MKELVLIYLVFFYLTGLVMASNRPLFNMFSDNKGRDVNDLITIVVSERTDASNASTNNSGTQQQTAFSAGPGTGGWANAISLFGSSANWQNTFQGNGGTTRSGNFTTTITAKVIKVLNSGNFQITGSKKIVINGEEEVINISGEVRPDDISANNTVYSYKLANVELSYKGKGAMDSGAKPGFFTRVLNWIF